MNACVEYSDPKGRALDWESKLVFEYFKGRERGKFVDVGANHPKNHSQTWFLEQQGWSGILVEPHPKLCQLLREQRPRSTVADVAVCAPGDTGHVDFYLAQRGSHSAIKPEPGTPLTGEVIKIVAKTLDSVLEELHAGEIDFLSLDIEGMELDALRGFNLAYWQPKLILIEDFFLNHQKHRYLKQRGYKLIRRTGYNNWYVPQSIPGTLFSESTPREIFRLARKFWFSPFHENLRLWRKTAKSKK
jgi:FkbM family methyltransferase